MKSSILPFILLLVIACQTKQQTLSNLQFQGRISHHVNDSVSILDDNYELVMHIPVDSSGHFSLPLSLETGYYSFNHGNESSTIFLKSGYDLSLTLDTEAFDETLTYEGIGKEPNNYLAAKYLLEEPFRALEYYGNYGKLEEDAFLHQSDSLYNLRQILLAQHTEGMDPEFLDLETASLKFTYLNRLQGYQNMRRFVDDLPDFEVSKSYPDAFKDFDLNQEKYLKVTSYRWLINSYLFKTAFEDPDSTDFYLKYLNYVDKSIKNPEYRRELYFKVGNQDIENSLEPDSVYKRVMAVVEDAEQRQSITEKYNKLMAVQPGKASPDFELIDQNSATVRLSDLRGKPVYIDVWATWCLPCIKEFPHLEKLQEEYGQTVHFVSIGYLDNKEKWIKMVREDELGGIQIFAEDEDPFMKHYEVVSLPRFILIDADGKIVNPNAMRPSDERLPDEFDKLLSGNSI